jgi:anti-anti-sigma factor
MGVERGPGWVFVSVHPPQDYPAIEEPVLPEAPSLAEDVWDILQQHMVDRVVLQMDGVDFVSSRLIGQLVLLHKRIHNAGGIIRLCGLTPHCEQALKSAGLAGRFPHYDRLDDAVRGMPVKPR